MPKPKITLLGAILGGILLVPGRVNAMGGFPGFGEVLFIPLVIFPLMVLALSSGSLWFSAKFGVRKYLTWVRINLLFGVLTLILGIAADLEARGVVTMSREIHQSIFISVIISTPCLLISSLGAGIALIIRKMYFERLNG